MSKLDDLTRAAQEASEVRGYQTDPDVIALRIERIRAWCDRLVWTGIVAGLLFTAANVQHFAAGAAKPPWDHGGSIDWVIAWLLDPMVSLVLIGVLMGEQIVNRYGIKAGAWVRITKWVALGCTYSMNTWSSWDSKDASSILLHSVPPVIVVCAVEAVPTLRRQITEAVTKAYRAAVADNAETLVIHKEIPAPVAPETDPEEVDTSEWPDTPESLDRWLPVPEVQPVPEQRVHVPDDRTQPIPAIPPSGDTAVPAATDMHFVAAAKEFGAEVRNGKMPGIKRIQNVLGIGQKRAYLVQAYLKTITAE